MIDPPPILTIRRRWTRPGKAAIAAFAGVPTSMVADAQRGRGGLDHRIRPLDPAMRIAGPAITCWCGPADNLAALAALELAQPGDVIVIACDGFEGVGVVGDRFAGMARNRRLGGIVVDGLVRDTGGILAAGVPCYGRGVTPSSAYAMGPGEVNLPIAVGSTVIEAGDLILGDGDGLIVVPRRTLPAAQAALKRVTANERRLDKEVAAGAQSFPWVAELMRSSKTKYVD